SIKNIHLYLGIRKSLAYFILGQYRDYGLVQPALQGQGQPLLLNPTDICYLSSLLDLQPCIYLDEIQAELEQAHCIHISLQVLVRALQKLDSIWKTISVCALEWNELECSHYMLQIAKLVPQPVPDMLMFIDEAACNLFRNMGMQSRDAIMYSGDNFFMETKYLYSQQ
ncbi:hypothetical protein BT96DRAFT_838711, partial [Gymnopus androsaceus JB14]